MTRCAHIHVDFLLETGERRFGNESCIIVAIIIVACLSDVDYEGNIRRTPSMISQLCLAISAIADVASLDG